jgi:hypothetical protein
MNKVLFLRLLSGMYLLVSVLCNNDSSGCVAGPPTGLPSQGDIYPIACIEIYHYEIVVLKARVWDNTSYWIIGDRNV